MDSMPMIVFSRLYKMSKPTYLRAIQTAKTRTNRSNTQALKILKAQEHQKNEQWQMIRTREEPQSRKRKQMQLRLASSPSKTAWYPSDEP
ncbi:hypothetical protein AC1031_020512 [Aphanomyces cochlioides]|nr:hypothetical protein AC1031_020512 [Aphanomyces cochlioides]